MAIPGWVCARQDPVPGKLILVVYTCHNRVLQQWLQRAKDVYRSECIGCLDLIVALCVT